MTETRQTTREAAEVRTANARRYLGQLCKHFAHKIPVEFDEATLASGRIVFGLGTCDLAAAEETLRMTVEARPEDIVELRGIVDRHLIRFAFREELAIDWRPV